MKNKEFIASDIKETKCLCVPHWYMKKTEKLKNWTFVRFDLEQSIFQTITKGFKKLRIMQGA